MCMCSSLMRRPEGRAGDAQLLTGSRRQMPCPHPARRAGGQLPSSSSSSSSSSRGTCQDTPRLFSLEGLWWARGARRPGHLRRRVPGGHALGQAGAASKLVHPLGWQQAGGGGESSWVGNAEEKDLQSRAQGKLHSHVFWALPQFLDGCLLSAS